MNKFNIGQLVKIVSSPYVTEEAKAGQKMFVIKISKSNGEVDWYECHPSPNGPSNFNDDDDTWPFYGKELEVV